MFEFFNLGSFNKAIRKHVWCFASIISVFVFDVKQKYSKIMKNVNLEGTKIGIQIDKSLKWKQQINHVAVKLNEANAMLSKLRHSLDKKL